MTLNAAHGRRDGPNQLFLERSAFDTNLALISDLLRQSNADIVALQEVDGPSRWSGRFDHARTLAKQADYPWHYRGDHATSWLFEYGTALLSRLPLKATRSHRFQPSLPSPRKGFVIGQIALPAPSFGIAELIIDVFSVHFDYLSRRAQASQLEELIDVLARRVNPVIVLGDFNSTWQRPDSTVRELVRRADLAAHQPGAEHLATHGDERLDWILISEEFRFEQYRVLPDVVSDHQPVLATIGLNRDTEVAATCRGPDHGMTAASRGPALR
jgi:endonuclease/exonuclease/phosphatase family metal-dependent hydrolase